MITRKNFYRITKLIKLSSLDFNYTQVFFKWFNYRHNRITIFTCHRKRSNIFRLGTTLEKNWLNVSQSPSSVDIVLPSSTRLIFHLLLNLGVNNGVIVLEKLLLSISFLVPRFLSVFREFFTEISLDAVVFLLVSFRGFRNIYLNFDLFMMALSSSFDMKGASLVRLHFYKDMAIKYLENSAFIHTKIIHIRSSCNYIISEVGSYYQTFYNRSWQ